MIGSITNVQSFQLQITNWRLFTSHVANIQLRNTLILDKNGAGKTSLLSALYTVLTQQAWPGTKFKDSLRQGEQYFGLQIAEHELFVNGIISPTGRLNIKKSEDTVEEVYGYNVLTYVPNDNQWLFLSRSARLEIFDNLVGQIQGNTYYHQLNLLQKYVATKSRIIRAAQHGEAVDMVLVKTLTDSINHVSQSIWRERQQVISFFRDSLNDFAGWIDTTIDQAVLMWSLSSPMGLATAINEHTQLPVLHDWQNLWAKEMVVGKVLYGAQRDDISFVFNGVPAQSFFSRGEMRAFIVFLKKLVRQKIDKPVIWLLDDIFNEFDDDRESIVLDNLIKAKDIFIATGTRNPLFGSRVTIATLDDIITPS